MCVWGGGGGVHSDPLRPPNPYGYLSFDRVKYTIVWFFFSSYQYLVGLCSNQNGIHDGSANDEGFEIDVTRDFTDLLRKRDRK